MYIHIELGNFSANTKSKNIYLLRKISTLVCKSVITINLFLYIKLKNVLSIKKQYILANLIDGICETPSGQRIERSNF